MNTTDTLTDAIDGLHERDLRGLAGWLDGQASASRSATVATPGTAVRERRRR